MTPIPILLPLLLIPEPPSDMAAMIRAMSATSYRAREAATERLACRIACHPTERIYLDRARLTDADPEVRMRCRLAIAMVPWCSACDGAGRARDGWRCEGCGGRRVRQPLGR